MTEKTLSEKKKEMNVIGEFYFHKHVKEAIEKLNEDLGKGVIWRSEGVKELIIKHIGEFK